MKFELYKKMLKGETNPEETRLVNQWLEEDPVFFENAMTAEARQMPAQQMPEPVRQDMLHFFEQQGIGQVHYQQKTPVIPVTRKAYRWVAAAAILIAVTAGWWWLKPAKQDGTPVAWKEVRNNSKEVMAITLPDSSKIWLNVLAAIRYPGDFNNHPERTVQLTGEAYFKVAHDTGHPFVVQTENLFTKVLGTEFNVEAYPGEQQIKVCLQKGKVQVNYRDTVSRYTAAGKILLPGQMATFYKKNAAIAVKQTTLAMPEAWIENGLVLNDVPLPDALRRIALRYDRKIEFNPELATRYRHVTASYRNMELSQVLSQLGFVCNFSVKKIKDTYRVDLQ
ncbi:MAG: FecR domain-containing protein [Chitinophagaceae bacterium]